MPYVIIARVEPRTEPLIVGRICRAHLVSTNDGRKIYKPARLPSLANIVRDPAASLEAPTFSLDVTSGEALAGLSGGSYLDLSEIKNAIEMYTDETCRISSSAMDPKFDILEEITPSFE
jgi:hypothetical protein